MARKRRDMLAERDLFTLAAIIVLIAQGVLFRRFSFDDTFICYRYARHLGEGLGPVMNLGERVEGVSNLPWTGLLGLLAWLDLEPHTMGPILSFASGLALLVVVSELASRVFDDRRAGGPTALFLAAAAPLAVWSVSGLETVGYTLLLTLCFWRAHTELSHQRSGWGTGFLLGAVACMRPEGLAYAVVLWAAAPRSGRWLLSTATAAAAVVAPLVVFRVLYYGDWFPNPVYAKATLGTAAIASGCVYVAKMILAAPLHFAAAVQMPRDGLVSPARTLLVGWIGMQCVLAWLSGGERVPGYRFLVPALPALAICIDVGLRNLRSATLLRQRIWQAVAWTVLVLCVFALVAPQVLGPIATRVLGWVRTQSDAAAHSERLLAETRFAGLSLGALALGAIVTMRLRVKLAGVEVVEGSRGSRVRLGRLIHESKSARRAMAVVVGTMLVIAAVPTAFDPILSLARQPDPAVRFGRPVGEWLRENYADTTRVATNAAGALPYFSALPIIDMLGLTDRHIARVAADRSLWTGHEKGDGQYVLSLRPEMIIFGGPEGSATPWPFPGDQQIAVAAEFRREYQLRRVPLDGFDFVFYERIGSEPADAAPGPL